MEICIEKIDELKLNNTIFDEIADMTYVILCCKNNYKRFENVKTQLFKLKPTRNIKLIFNMGYKYCPLTDKPNIDLASIQYFIFKDALKKKYKRILWLEDDFELKDEISKKDATNIINFIKKNNPCIYGLGNFGLPSLLHLFSRHVKTYKMFLAHAVFYNETYMSKYIDFYDKHDDNTLHIDNTGINVEQFRYFKPLVFQKFPETDNKKEWEDIFQIKNFLLKFLNLEKSVEPGYTITYVFPYLIYFIILVIIIFVSIIIFLKFTK